MPEPARVGFDKHIRRNQRATLAVMAFMLALLFGVVFLVGYVLGAPPYVGLGIALVVSTVYLLVSYFRATDTVLLASGARPANPAVREEKLLLNRVEEMAIASGLPMPRVYVQDSRDINAFAAGLTPEKAVVCVTTGALEQLDQEELEGVLAHEMSHVLNRDVRLATVTVGVVGAIAMLAEIALRLMWFSGGRRDRRGGHPIVLVLGILGLVLAPLLARLTYLFLSRRREYLADATGAKLTRNPEGLARALEKIAGDLPDDPKGSKTVAALYIANPWTPREFSSAFHTHPPLRERVRRLRGM
ncbi:MAG TPA: M48 family metallopeptidase [Candidatus Thermoplasmatota archaeon]|nr:M48 family metallopeptidase [Candidatus Thermoplasmatota archaeon]